MYSLVYLCTRPVMISSVVLFSFKLILDVCWCAVICKRQVDVIDGFL